MIDFAILIEELSDAAKRPISDPERGIRIMLVLTKAFRAVGYQIPVLIGGSAVEYYTQGWYASADVDALLHSPHPKVDQVMKGLGFIKKGKDWQHSTIDELYVEFPGVLGDPIWNMDPDEIEIDDERVRIISLDALILDKVGSFLVDNPIDGVNVLALLRAGEGELDWEFIEEHARHEGSWAALCELRKISELIDWDTPPSRVELENMLDQLRVQKGAGKLGYDADGGSEHGETTNSKDAGDTV